jgi:Tol biopolymer transport system component
MGLDRGTKLGPYEILDSLGAGGMGEVYRARDTRLDRTVAIKVLAGHLAADQELHKRLEREARAVSSLSHPHICTLHDIGRENGAIFLVMEYLEGETLAGRLARGALQTQEVLRYGVQIADALDHAHRKGVLHRDLKPANIMMTKAGAKLLDFGLAKLEERPVAGDETVALTAALTEKGTILGTFQYMSPEQLEAQESDARTDIFAYGAVLYEMITGRRAFEGKTRLSVISAVMSHDPPPVSTLQPMVPPALDRVVQRCLAKDPDQRWQTARDLMLELQWIAAAGSQVGVPAPVAARRKSRELRWKVAAAALALISVAALAMLAAAGGWFRARSPGSGAARFLVTLPEGVTIAPGPYAPQLAISPDGRQLVVAAQEAGGARFLWVRPLDSFSTQRLEKTEGAAFPFWSPDGQFIGFFADDKLKKIPLSGGSPQTICDAGRGDGAAWSPDGQIVFSPETGNALQRVPASGGTPTSATTLDKSRGEVQHSWPQFLPDGRHFIYFAMNREPAKTGIYVQELGSAARTLLLTNATRAAYAANYLLFSRDGALLAQRLDLKRLAVQGEPIPIAEGVNTNEANGRAAFAVSESGVLAYRGGVLSVVRQLAWYDRQGKRLATLGEPRVYRGVAISPDEKSVAVSRGDNRGSFNIWVIELASSIPKRLTFDSPGTDVGPIWSPDSQRIIFGRRGGLSEVVVASGITTILYDGETQPFPNAWSPDGRYVIYRDPNTRFVSLLPLLGERKPQHVLDRPFAQSEFCFSPDGRWIAYMSSESGRPEVQVASFPSFGDKRPVSQNGGMAPKWRKDGKELFFFAPPGTLMTAEVRAGSKFETEIPRPLLRISASALLNIPLGTALYDVTGDGSKFLLNEALQGSTDPISVVLNWTAELRR